METKYELIGETINSVLDALNTLKFHYGRDNINVVNLANICLRIMENKINHSVYITFDDNIKLRSGGKDPKSNITREMNYVLEQEMKSAKLFETT